MKFGAITTLLLIAGAYYLGKDAQRRETATGMPVSPWMHIKALEKETKQQYKDLQEQYNSSLYSIGKG